jgi:pyridoxine 5-phosphate synthase
MPKLGVNIDHVASVREIRHSNIPDIALAAFLCEKAGADSIVVHLRKDRRHIKEKDLVLLKGSIKTRLNLEMSINDDIVNIACKLKPDQATIVPERSNELTTEGGLDVISNLEKIKRVLKKLEKNGIAVSLFVDPDKKQIDASAKMGAKRIELHTGRYADAKNKSNRKCYLQELKSAVGYARDKGLHVYAGHGLDYQNVGEVARIKGIEELNIGYSIVAQAVLIGLQQAVRNMRLLIR